MKLTNIHKTLTLGLQVTLLVGAILSAFQSRWLMVAVTIAIIVVTLLPLALGRRFDVRIPPEFEFLTVIFVYASLFLELWIAGFVQANPRLFKNDCGND